MGPRRPANRTVVTRVSTEARGGFPAGIPPTIPAALHRASERWHDVEALVDGELRMTFGQLNKRVQQAAGAFIASGLEPGDRVAIWAPNSASWIIASFGVYAAGGVLVPINTRFKAPEAAHVLNTSGARFLLTVTDFLGTDYVAALESLDLPALEERIVLEGPPSAQAVSFSEFFARCAKVPPTEVTARSDALGPD